MQNIPPDVVEQIRAAIQRPEGTFAFVFSSAGLTAPDVEGGVIFELPAGGHVFRLERTSDRHLRFYHASPGTGTRVADVDLADAPEGCTRALIALTWTPEKIGLHFGPQDVPETDRELLSAEGVPSKRRFQVGTDGAVHQIGDEGVEVMSVSVFQGGEPILTPTAIEAWRETKKAIEILWQGEANEGESFLHEVVVTNLTLTMLVTGFEAYAKKRFLELEQEGFTPATGPIIDEFFPAREREAGIAGILQDEAEEQGCSVTELVVDRGAINFQNYRDCKRAYNKAYGISFGDLDVDSETFGCVKRSIQYRHRVVHVSALLAMLNQAKVPPEDPVFSKRELAEEALRCFDQLISTLHESTLRERP